MNKIEVLRDGVRLVDPLLRPHGFSFVETASGPSCGGEFVSGEYRRADRRLELHFRWSLGLVAYHVGGSVLTHEDLTRAVRATHGVDVPARYPGFSDDPLGGFRHLAEDLSTFGQVFISGTAQEFQALAEWARQNPKPIGFAALG